MRVLTGSVTTGAGSTTGSVTGVGFAPKVVWVIQTDQGTNPTTQTCHLKTDTLGGTSSWQVGTNTVDTNAIVSLDADGFSWGTSLGQDSTRFDFCCWGTDDDILETGTYVGNATDNRNISLVTMTSQITFLFCVAATNSRGSLKISDPSTDNAFASFLANGGGFADQIQSMGAGAFQIGTTTINNDMVTYHYVALGTDATQLQQISYTGDGNDGREIAVNFKPKMAIIKRYTGGVFDEGRGVVRLDTLADDADVAWGVTDFSGPGDESANYIQAWDTDSIELGDHGRVNQSTIPYRAYIIQDEVAAAAPVESPGGSLGAPSPFRTPDSPYAWFKAGLSVLDTYKNLKWR